MVQGSIDHRVHNSGAYNPNRIRALDYHRNNSWGENHLKFNEKRKELSPLDVLKHESDRKFKYYDYNKSINATSPKLDHKTISPNSNSKQSSQFSLYNRALNETYKTTHETYLATQNGDISTLMINSIKGSKQDALEKLEFVPAAKQSVYNLQDNLKRKYTVLKAPSINKIQKQTLSSSPKTSTSPVSENTPIKTELGIPVPSVILSPELPDSQRFWTTDMKNKRLHSTGLYNRGNTCFLNATIQVLTHTAPLWNYLINIYSVNRKNQNVQKNSFGNGFHQYNNAYGGNYNIQDALLQHFRYVLKMTLQSGPYTTQTKSIVPQKILEGLHIVTKNMKIGRQEDAHEYLRYVLDAIQKAMLFQAKKENKILTKVNKCCLHVKSTTFLHRIFGGYTRSRIICSKCNNSSDCYEPILDLQMDLRNCNDIKQCLQKFGRKDILAGENKYDCPYCKKKQDATKQMTIERAPQVLTLQLKRFDSFAGPFGIGKISRQIHYPHKLNINDVVSKELKSLNICYELYSVLVHSGQSCNSGHYYSFCKSPKNQWFCFNDARVDAVKPETALNQSEAYLLFYNRITKIPTKSSNTVVTVESKKEDAALITSTPPKPKVNLKDQTKDNNGNIISLKRDLPSPNCTTPSKKQKVDESVVKKGLVADYEDSSTTSSSSSTISKREKFLKRKADRMSKLDLSEKPKPAQPPSTSFFSLNVNSWSNNSSEIDKQVKATIKSQSKSSLDPKDLEYDQEKIEKADRKFVKREKKREENRLYREDYKPYVHKFGQQNKFQKKQNWISKKFDNRNNYVGNKFGNGRNNYNNKFSNNKFNKNKRWR